MKNKNWFTLVEVIVAITIFSLMMVSVIVIFAQVSKVNKTVEANRSIQENIKKSIEYIAEDVRLSEEDWTNREVDLSTDLTKVLKVWDNEYYLAKKDSDTWAFRLVSNDICTNEETREVCYIVKENHWDIIPLTNSDINVKYLNFNISNADKDYPRITMTLETSAPKWTFNSEKLMKDSEILIQTTFWKRIIPNVK